MCVLANGYVLIALQNKFKAICYKIYIQMKTVHMLHIMEIHDLKPNVSYPEFINYNYLFYCKIEGRLLEHFWAMCALSIVYECGSESNQWTYVFIITN
jgi:hypothetical protein